jgi:hypothetical protein
MGSKPGKQAEKLKAWGLECHVNAFLNEESIKAGFKISFEG